MDSFHYLSVSAGWRKKIGEFPKSPGVYSFRGKKGILYIGKAANLKVRVKNHFAQPTWRDNRFIHQTTRVGYIELASEIEAFILESRLIKKYKPRYNVLLKDDKQYFYICFTNEKLPRLILTHQPTTTRNSPLSPPSYPKRGGNSGGVLSAPPSLDAREGAGGVSYRKGVVGPFTDGKSLKTVLRYLRKPFPYYTQKHRKLPCSYCHIGLCPGANPDISQYKKDISKIKAILKGRKPRVLTSLKKEMAQFSREQKFEKAGKARDQIRALENIFSHNVKIQMPNDKSITNDKAQMSNSNLAAHGLSFAIYHLSLEAYDISNIQGREPVASMVRFDKGKPNKAMYRKFRIRLPEKPNDVAMIKEVIRRRLAHPEWPYPDVFLIDGGRGQLNAALFEMRSWRGEGKKSNFGSGKLNFEEFARPAVIALAKRFNELYLPNRKSPIPLLRLPQDTKNLLMHARDEAHRFAISYHRKLHRQTFR